MKKTEAPHNRIIGRNCSDHLVHLKVNKGITSRSPLISCPLLIEFVKK